MDTQDQRGKVATKSISLRIPADLYQRFTDAATADHRSIAGEVRYLIETRVIDHEEKAAA